MGAGTPSAIAALGRGLQGAPPTHTLAVARALGTLAGAILP